MIDIISVRYIFILNKVNKYDYQIIWVFLFQEEELDKELRQTTRYGPQVIYSVSTEVLYGISSRNGCQMRKTCMKEVIEILAVVMAVYHILDLTYPAAYAQCLGTVQELVLGVSFEFKTKETKNFLSSFELWLYKNQFCSIDKYSTRFFTLMNISFIFHARIHWII